MNMSTLIVDDESRARATLILLLRTVAPDTISGVLEASDIGTACLALTTHTPDLVFLDIELGHDSGLDVLEQSPTQRDFSAVIITGYEKYGVRAARCGVLDYLLKPVDPDELRAAVRKAEYETQQRRLLKTVQPDTRSFAEIYLPVPITRGRTIFLSASSVTACCAWGPYCNFYCADGRTLLAGQLLKEYEPLLIQAGFVRISRSAFVNPAHVQQCGNTAVEAWVEMPNALVLPIARRRKKEVLARLIRR